MFLRKSPRIFFNRYKNFPSVLDFYSKIESDEKVFKFDDDAPFDWDDFKKICIDKVPQFDRVHKVWVIGRVFEDDESMIFVKNERDLVITKLFLIGFDNLEWEMGDLKTFLGCLRAS